MKTISALFDNVADARGAVDDLYQNGFTTNNVSLVANDASKRFSGTEMRTDAVNADEGASFGAATGAVTGILAGIAALAIPGVGPIVALGPILGGLTGGAIGAAAGAVTGGLVASLIKTGLTEEEASMYAEGVRRGSTLVTVNADSNQVDLVQSIFNRHHAVNAANRTANWANKGWTRFDESATDPYIRDFGVYDADFHKDYSTNYGSAGRDYTYYEPSYRFGYDLAYDPNYDVTDWAEVEPYARERWLARYPETVWDDIKNSVRYAWQRVRNDLHLR